MEQKVSGVTVGPEAETDINEQGGMQSKLETRLDLLPPRAIFAEGVVLAEGANKYEPWNWKKIPIEDHINHALVHLFAHLLGDRSDAHLAHAACRVHFALELAEESRERHSHKLSQDEISSMLDELLTPRGHWK